MQVQRSQSFKSNKKKRPYKKKKKRSQSTNWFLVGLGLSGIAMLSATAGALLAVGFSSKPFQVKPPTADEKAAFNQQEAVSDTMPLQLPELKRPVNILVLGTKDLDKAPEDSSPEKAADNLVSSFDGNTDAMLLLRFDPSSNDLTLLSIPRDTQVHLARYGTKKINAANRYGGASYTAEVVSDLLSGVEIDRYIRVNLDGVEQLIDALGGVKMYVPKDMEYHDVSQNLHIDLEKGKQTLDGETAIEFLRFRHDQYGDIGRVQRQQMFLRAMRQQALSPSTLGKLPSIFSVIQTNVDTNLTIKEMLALAGFASKRKKENVEMLMLPGEFHEVTQQAGETKISYWLPHQRQIHEMMAQYFDVNQIGIRNNQQVRSNIRIAIQNSTDNSAAVRSVMNQLKQEGFHNVYQGSPWTQPLQQTRIIAQTGNVQAAKAVADALGMGQVRVESTGELNSVVSIQLGKDWLEHSSE